MRRSTLSAGRLPNGRSDQPQPPDGCPTGEGLVTPTAGLDRGRRAKSTPSFRSALLAKDQRQLRFSSIPSWATLRSCPCNRDHAPRVSMVGNLGKSQTVQSLSTARDPQKRACGPLSQTAAKSFTKVACKAAALPAQLPPQQSEGQHVQKLTLLQRSPRVEERRPAMGDLPVAVEAPQRKPGRGSVMPCSSNNASSNARKRSSVRSQSRLFPSLG